MDEHREFTKVFQTFTPEVADDINNLDLTPKASITPAQEYIADDLNDDLRIEKRNYQFKIVTLAEWFRKYCNMVSSVRPVTIQINGVDPNESIVVTIPNDQGKRFRDHDKRHLRLVEYANIIPVIDAEPIDMFMYNNGYQILYDIGGGTYLKGYSVRKKFIVNICKDVMDFMIPIGQSLIKRGDSECKFSSYDLSEIIEMRIRNNLLDNEKLTILYHQSKKFEFKDFKSLLKCLTTRQGGIKDVQHQLEIDNAIQKLCLDGVQYET
jgi:hypothetical protein